MKYFKKLLLLILFSSSVLISATHHHADFKHHSDCPICFFQLNNISDSPDLNPIKINIPKEKFVKCIKKLKNYQIKISIKLKARSPPFYI